MNEQQTGRRATSPRECSITVFVEQGQCQTDYAEHTRYRLSNSKKTTAVHYNIVYCGGFLVVCQTTCLTKVRTAR